MKNSEKIKDFSFATIDVSKQLGVTNKTIINRCAKLASTGFLVPNIVKERVRTYSLSDFAKSNGKQIVEMLHKHRQKQQLYREMALYNCCF